MNWQRIIFPIVGAVFVAGAWRAAGWPGVAAAAAGLLMWTLLHFTRLMHILKRASESPVGHVSSAVMLNARLRPKSTLMHVVAMTKALGEQLSPKEIQPEVYRWTDTGGSHVTCEFAGGKLMKWTLWRPPVQEDEPATPAT